MSKYTVKGSAELDAKIDADMARITDVVSPHGLAGILLGGYGRGEGTPFINSDGTQAPFNDYDLVVVVDRLGSDVRKTFQTLEKKLTAELGLPVDLCPYLKSALPDCEFSLLNYEMKYGHHIIWGDTNIIDAMPEYPHDAIPFSEGSRLLLNRGKLLLDLKERLNNSEPLSDEERIRFIKFIYKAWLALGDCALLAAGQYDISYSVKKERIHHMDACAERDAVVEGFLKAVALKEWGDFRTLEDYTVESEFKRARDIFLKFFPWYRTQYPTGECSLIKAAVLNLRWNGRPLPRHPRLYLYDALMELLQDEPNEAQLTQTLFSNDNHVERFYMLQRRVS